jgi:L-amino acid N-acyltransferase YncA
VAERRFMARSATIADATRITEIYNQGIRDRIATFETEPRTVETVRGWFNQPYPVVVVVADDNVIAWASTSSYRPRACYAGNAEFSVYVHRDWRGRGVGSLAMQALIEEARSAGLEKLVSRVFIENEASLRMLGKLGFRAVGIYERHGQLDGVWRDVVIVECPLQDHSDEPRGALWQPDPETLDLWDTLSPGTDLVIEKRPWESDRSPIRYEATLVASAIESPWIEARAEWTMDTTDAFGLVFEKGSELREFFSPRHPFNVFGVYAPDGDFRGWYGNVTWPARAEREGETLILAWPDLVLDLVMLPDGSTIMLDDDELDASGLRESSPRIVDQMIAARDELKRLLKTGFFPRLS